MEEELKENHLLMVINFENNSQNECQRQSLLISRKILKYKGRKSIKYQLQNSKQNKNLSITQITKISGRVRTTIYTILKDELNYIT